MKPWIELNFDPTHFMHIGGVYAKQEGSLLWGVENQWARVWFMSDLVPTVVRLLLHNRSESSHGPEHSWDFSCVGGRVSPTLHLSETSHNTLVGGGSYANLLRLSTQGCTLKTCHTQVECMADTEELTMTNHGNLSIDLKVGFIESITAKGSLNMAQWCIMMNAKGLNTRFYTRNHGHSVHEAAIFCLPHMLQGCWWARIHFLEEINVRWLENVQGG